jgi:hypothetical protein
MAVRKRTAEALQNELQQPNFIYLLRRFLYGQIHPDSESDSDIPVNWLPAFHAKISVYASAVATYFAPSDLCGIGGMRRERIRAVPSWRRGPARYDCVFVNADPSAEGMRGLDVARVRAFFSFKFRGVNYPCALVHWFSRIGDKPDKNTGMWVVEPEFDFAQSPLGGSAIIHLDTIFRAAHLLGVCNDNFLPRNLTFHDSLDTFHSYYVNKFIDHHAFEIAF